MVGNDPTVGSSYSLAERYFVYPKLEPNHDMLNPPINQESDFHFLQEPEIFSNALWSAPRYRSFGYVSNSEVKIESSYCFLFFIDLVLNER